MKYLPKRIPLLILAIGSIIGLLTLYKAEPACREQGSISTVSRVLCGVFGSTGEWNLIAGDGLNGSWPAGRHDRVRAIATYEGSVFAGLGYTGAELYRQRGSTWENITGPWIARDPSSGGFIKQPFSEVAALQVHDNALYVGLGSRGAQLWRLDKTGWLFVGSWLAASSVYEMESFDNKLFLGFHQGWESGAAHGNKLVSWQGNTLKEESVPWDNTVNWIYAMVSDGERLYVSTVSEPTKDARVATIWQMSKSDGRYVWERIGGQGLNGSWQIDTRHIATSMVIHNGELVVGINCQDCSDFSHVWRYSGKSWSRLGEKLECQDNPALPPVQRSFNALTSVQGKLIAAGGAAGRPEAFAVWQYDGRWECLTAVDDEDEDAWKRNQYGYSLRAIGREVLLGTLGEAHLFQRELPPDSPVAQ